MSATARHPAGRQQGQGWPHPPCPTADQYSERSPVQRVVPTVRRQNNQNSAWVQRWHQQRPHEMPKGVQVGPCQPHPVGSPARGHLALCHLHPAGPWPPPTPHYKATKGHGRPFLENWWPNRATTRFLSHSCQKGAPTPATSLCTPLKDIVVPPSPSPQKGRHLLLLLHQGKIVVALLANFLSFFFFFKSEVPKARC